MILFKAAFSKYNIYISSPHTFKHNRYFKFLEKTIKVVVSSYMKRITDPFYVYSFAQLQKITLVHKIDIDISYFN